MVTAPEQKQKQIDYNSNHYKKTEYINTTKVDKISYNDLEKRTLEFIKQREWYTPKAQLDVYHYTNGYGTIWKYPWEVISREEAERRAIERIRELRRINNTYDMSDDIEMAIISFTYNLWPYNKNYIIKLAKQWKRKELRNEMLVYNKVRNSKTKKLEFSRWIYNRRVLETNLFYKK